MSELREFRIATFNLFNLVLPEVRYYGSRRYKPDEFIRKRDWLAAQLARMNAEIVGFQEVFHHEALKQVIDVNGLYPGATILTNERFEADTGQPLPANGLVTRFPVVESSVVTNFPDAAKVSYDGLPVPVTEFSRPVLRAKLRLTDTLELLVLVAHLKSKRPMIDEEREDKSDPVVQALGRARSLIRRAAEAVALRAVLVESLRETRLPVVVLGDMNDSVSAVTSEIMAGAPPWRFLPREQKEAIWDVLLYNVKDIQARRSYVDVYFTHIFNGHYDALDHILVSEEWVRENPDHVGQVVNVRVYNDHIVDETLALDDVPNWQSDHGQVVAEIRLRRPRAPIPPPTPA
ncbi:MAG: endonuclease/exonuclease/phosphatase family protein [Chloroflexi bacterium]|nr:endonuclease/exonuclease/phosphatase family protein [Chloroflexota bacterium]